MLKLIKHGLILLLIPGSLWAQNTFLILEQPVSARNLALSGGGSAISSLDYPANPAVIDSDGPSLVVNYLKYPADIAVHHVGAVYPLASGAISCSILQVDYGTFVDGDTQETFTGNDLVLQAAWSSKLWDSISYGVSLDYVRSNLADYTAQGLAVSAGVRTRLMNERLGLGLTLDHLGTMLDSYTGVDESLPTSVRLGTFYQPRHLPARISIDVIRYTDEDIRAIAAVEFASSERFEFRISTTTEKSHLEVGSYDEEFVSGLAGGFTLKFDHFMLDLGLQDLGPAGVVSAFGFRYTFSK